MEQAPSQHERTPRTRLSAGKFLKMLSLAFPLLGIPGDARQELDPRRAHSFSPEVRESVYYAIQPFNYFSDRYFSGNFASDINPSVLRERVRKGFETGMHFSLESAPAQNIPGLKRRLDAWRIYLGLEQKFGTFSRSRFAPSDAKDKDGAYWRINDFLENAKEQVEHYNKHAKEQGYIGSESLPQGKASHADVIQYFWNKIHRRLKTPADAKGRRYIQELDFANDVMGTYKFGFGEDEQGSYLYYYDLWDLDKSLIEGKEGFVGRPFEIYDRIYFDRKTFQPIEVAGKGQ